MADSPLPPPGMADALNVKPAVAIAAAAKPIAILRIMMLTSNRSEHPSLSESNSAVLIELQRAALSPGVWASESQLVVAGGGGFVPLQNHQKFFLPFWIKKPPPPRFSPLSFPSPFPSPQPF